MTFRKSRTGLWCRRGIARRDVIVCGFIIAIVGMLLVTVVHNQRVKYRRVTCELRQMRLARALLYYDMGSGSFPGYCDIQSIDAQGNPRPASWVFFTLPFLQSDESADRDGMKREFKYRDEKQRIDEEGLDSRIGPFAETFQQFGPEAPDEWRGKTPNRYIAELVCPDNLRPTEDAMNNGWMSYVVNTGMPDAEPTDVFPADWPANGVFTNQFPVLGAMADRMSFELLQSWDGAGGTLLLTENVDSGMWTDVSEAQVGFCWTPKQSGDDMVNVLWINQRAGQGDGSARFARPSSYHQGGVNVAFCDGRTDFLTEDVDFITYTQWMTSDSKNVRWAGTDLPVDQPEHNNGSKD